MEEEPSEIAVVQISRTEYIMKFYDDMVDQIPRKCILCPWNQRETHCLHRWPHIWNSCTNGASHHQNMRELPLKQKRIRIRNLYCSNITRIYRGTIHTIKIRVRKWYLYRLTKACHNYFMCTCTWTHTHKKNYTYVHIWDKTNKFKLHIKACTVEMVKSQLKT